MAGSSTGSSTAARNATKRRTEETESNEASTQSGVEKPVRGVRNVSRPGTQRPAVIDDNIETSPKQTDQRRKLKRSANTALDSDSAIQVEVEAQGPFSRTKETAKRRKGEAIEGEIEGDGAKMLLDKTRDGGNRRESKESQTLKSRGRNTGEKDTFDGNATDSGTHTTIPNTMKSKFNKTSTNTDTPMLPNTTVNNTSNTYTHAHSNNNNNSDSDVAEPVLMSPLRRSGRNVKVAAPSPLITRRGLKITDLPSKKETVKKAKAKATATSSSDSERSGVAKKNVKQFNIVVVEGNFFSISFVLGLLYDIHPMTSILNLTSHILSLSPPSNTHHEHTHCCTPVQSF